MKLIPSFLVLFFAISMSACVQIYKPVETAVSGENNLFVTEVKSKDFAVEKPNREAE